MGATCDPVAPGTAHPSATPSQLARGSAANRRLCHHGGMPAIGHRHANDDVHTPDAADPHERLHHESPDAAVQSALAALRARGERVTNARRAVLDVLARTHKHVSADQVASLLEGGHPRVHRATVYRTLDLLADRGIVSSVHAIGAAIVYHFAAPPPEHEHLHAHCRECGDVVMVPADCLDVAAVEILRVAGLAIEPRRSTLVGMCVRCAAADQPISTKMTSIALFP